jgi:hypothetical protein
MHAHAGDADFTLVNSTGFTLREIYLSPTSKETWGNDRMGNGFLDNGKSRLFKFADKSSCNQDLKIVFDDDDSKAVWSNIDLCSVDKITIKYNRSTGVTSAVFD